MPANLPPEYFQAEKRFMEAATLQDKVIALEELIATVPKHKGTDKLRADLRRRLAQLREEAVRRKKSGKGDLYAVEKQGACQVENSRIIRVYSKEPGREPDRATPFVLPAGSTVLALAEMIHRDFLENLKYACIWGSAKFDGQRVQKDYVLHDRDIVEYHLK